MVFLFIWKNGRDVLNKWNHGQQAFNHVVEDVGWSSFNLITSQQPLGKSLTGLDCQCHQHFGVSPLI